MMKKFVRIILVTSWAGLAACGVGGEGGNTSPAGEIAHDALANAGEAYRQSILSAEMQALAINAPLDGVQQLAFDGSTTGSNGSASWNGQIGPTQNLDLNYTLTFDNYQASSGGAILDGSMEVSVSQNNSSCTGTWNFSNISVSDGFDNVQISSDGSGLILSGSDCADLNLTGSLSVSGDFSASGCNVGGTNESPVVICD